MAIYMQVEGIEGDVSETDHNKWIEVDSFSWGVGRPIVTQPGKVGDRANSRPNFGEISITKAYDSSSPKLFTWSTTGGGKKVTFHFTKEGGQKFLEFVLESVIPSNYSISGNTTADPGESLSFNYTKIEIKRVPYDDKNKAGTPVPVGYDLKTEKAS